MIAASVALLLALTSGGTRVPWISPDDLRAGRAVDRAHRAVRLVAPARARAVPAAQRARQSGDAGGHDGDLLRARRDDRLHDLHAALLSGRAQAHRHAIRPRAHPGDRAHHAGLDAVGPRHDVSAPLQDVALCRHVARRPLAVAALVVVAGDAARLGDLRDRRDRVRRRHACSRSRPCRSRTRSRGTTSAPRPAR